MDARVVAGMARPAHVVDTLDSVHDLVALHSEPTAMASRNPEPTLEELVGDLSTDEQKWILFDADARRLLGMSGEAFLAKWDRGDYFDFDPEERTLEGQRLNEMIFSMLMIRPWSRGAERPQPDR